MQRLSMLSAEEIWAVAELALARRDYPEASMDGDDPEFFWQNAVNSQCSLRFDPEIGIYDSMDLQQFELHRTACRKFLGLPSSVPGASGERRNIATTEELRGVLPPLLKGAPYDSLLVELVGRHDDIAAMAAIEVAVRPDSVSWQGLLEAAPDLEARLLNAWLASDPTNAVAVLRSERYESSIPVLISGGGSTEPYRGRPVLAHVERANEYPTLAYSPRPPWLSDELLSRVRAILEQDGIAFVSRPTPVRWSNPWRWHADWETAHSLLCTLARDELTSIKTDKLADAERFRAAGETLIGKFMTAPPRELATVLKGCSLLEAWLDRFPNPEQASAADMLRANVRKTACYRLAKRLTELSFDLGSGPIVDETMMSAWMAGLVDCYDERAGEMLRAIDAWAEFDRRAVEATYDKLHTIYREQWNEAVPLDADGQPVLERMHSEAGVYELDPSGLSPGDSIEAERRWMPIGRSLRTCPIELRG